MTDQPSLNLDEFSLAKGGPFFKLPVRMRLMRPDLALAHRRAVVLALFTWLPLLILSAFQGLALGGSVRIPFLFDFPISVRLLLGLPLLILAENVIAARAQMLVIISVLFIDRVLFSFIYLPHPEANSHHFSLAGKIPVG